jgi:hypothetical protein
MPASTWTIRRFRHASAIGELTARTRGDACAADELAADRFAESAAEHAAQAHDKMSRRTSATHTVFGVLRRSFELLCQPPGHRLGSLAHLLAETLVCTRCALGSDGADVRVLQNSIALPA